MMKIEHIKREIENDKENMQFTKMGWKPILRVSENARILIIGQAPGLKTQEAEDVFRDKSGDRLREWLGVDESLFYESGLIAVLPMDFYFPGNGKSGDLPPRKDIAAKWHPQLIAAMPHIELTILIGMYAQKYYLGKSSLGNVTENVLGYQHFLPRYFPLVHPSPRNQIWISKHPEFLSKIIPELQYRIKRILSDSHM
ncbi:uracil-DNA glycosylase family protein [Erysipelothrix sp. HDW6C]|uniref:uracil-DNA glycosylase family protein n=1 Tax=Erysipelothrix sp. HDW6C TaxID=2714930 RepID=UPI00140AD5FA|nr:uracil-DNA glycosylase family protein [Erysipelothrix sp. HDW6C]QIK69371.1 uracil-DNA glycosylase family protein [Erysipelothrix sp. HDW6C]